MGECQVKSEEERLRACLASKKWRDKQPREAFLSKRRVDERERRRLEKLDPNKYEARRVKDRLKQTAYKKLHREKVRAYNMKRSLARNYGLSIEDRRNMIEEQGGRCYICRSHPKPGRTLQVDHCHTSNVVRKMLCEECNRGLGQFKDSPELLRAAASYIEETKGVNL